ncbi:anti-sigma regulatory factor (Ser/Thr protein kinase) [Actinoplanes octamycinicus]|uniref:Anti-sigma regulatory factor (Ser/Thr protein kinase) n=1 Tax=Actinoplanes octamycinicus TaxID=135948 RepID=A0A7W7H7H2_9ACTN|nr:ATP-binding protein [Actinoplanes octamycinicus]MBB4745274.1 anti-sigma regulatory factor (Ser/Thr protein kinase) [Actinoplanes octamycinicus]
MHAALIIETDRDLDMLAAELNRSAKRYDEVLVVVGERTRAVLAGLAGDLPDAVCWGAQDGFYQRLGFAYERFRRYLAAAHRAGRRAHVIAEPDLTHGVDAGLRADRVAAYLEYEAICNRTYALDAATVTCVWDCRDHPATVLDRVRATHPHLVTSVGRMPSPDYLQPERYLTERRHLPMGSPPADVDHDVSVGGVAGLSGLRSALGRWAADHRFDGEAMEDLVTAVVEVATNGLRHGDPPVRVRAWHHGDTLVVQCDDAGSRPLPAEAGFLRPDPVAAVAGGRGLWLARQLADMVMVSSEPGRTSVRLHFPREIMLAASS